VVEKLAGFIVKDEIMDLCKRNILIERFYDADCVQDIMYDLRLGEEIYITPDENIRRLRNKDIINIQSGQFALLTTKEYLNMPNNFFGLITIRMKYKSKGLINISGFHVDPGFKGYLIFSVFNAGPSNITLRAGEPIFSILFYKLDEEVRSKERTIEEIPCDILEPLIGAKFPSLLELEKKINRNTLLIQVICTIASGLFISIIINFLFKS